MGEAVCAVAAQNRGRDSNAEPCWICGSTTTQSWKGRSLDSSLRPEDLRVTDSRYGMTLALRRCLTCGFVFAVGDELSELTSLYERVEDDEYERSQGPRRQQMRWLLDRALEVRPEAHSLLDVGAGMGLLVAEARRRGLQATGIEPSHSFVKRALEVNGVELIQGVLPHPAVGTEEFDLLLLIDVIEHVSDPVGLLRCCASALAQQGAMIIVTPDVASPAARLLGHRWWHFRFAHVGYYDRCTLARAADLANLVLLRSFRARWALSVGYLAERVARYLPVDGFLRIGQRAPVIRAFFDAVVPLNLHDSWLFVLVPAEAPHLHE